MSGGAGGEEGGERGAGQGRRPQPQPQQQQQPGRWWRLPAAVIARSAGADTAALPAPCGKHWVRRGADSLLSRLPSLSPVFSPPKKPFSFLPFARPSLTSSSGRLPAPGCAAPAAPASAAHIARAAAPSGERGEPGPGACVFGCGCVGCLPLLFYPPLRKQQKAARAARSPRSAGADSRPRPCPRRGGVPLWGAVSGRWVGCAWLRAGVRASGWGSPRLCPRFLSPLPSVLRRAPPWEGAGRAGWGGFGLRLRACGALSALPPALGLCRCRFPAAGRRGEDRSLGFVHSDRIYTL